MTKTNAIFRAPAAIALTLVGALALSGCNSGDAERIAELEQQVQELEAERGSATDDSTASTTTTTTTPATTTVTPPEPDANVLANYPEIADFDSRVAALEESCKGVTASGDANADYRTYLDKKVELDMLDDEMDRYDDEQERAAAAGTISYADYVEIETAIDRLSDRLEYAEDSMMFELGIYDD